MKSIDAEVWRVQVEVVAPADKKALLHSKKNGDGASVLRAWHDGCCVCARVPGRGEPLSCSDVPVSPGA